MITLFGATGYTGTLIARALSKNDLPFRLAGRSEQKLAALSASLPSRPEWVTANALQPDSLSKLFAAGKQGRTKLLINCAGPYTDLGEKVLSISALNGVHYMDINNELKFRINAQGYHQLALTNGVSITPACGFEVAFADCLTALLAVSWGMDQTFDELEILYLLRGSKTSAGTRRSAVRSLATSWMAWKNGEWVGQVPGTKYKTIFMDGNKDTAMAFPSCESVTARLHSLIDTITVWMDMPRGTSLWGPVLVPMAARAARSILRPLMLSLVSRGSARGGEESGGGDFKITVTLKQGSMGQSLSLAGQDMYGLTAEIAVYAARRILAQGFSQAGVLAPSQMLGAKDFIDFACQHWGVHLA